MGAEGDDVVRVEGEGGTRSFEVLGSISGVDVAEDMAGWRTRLARREVRNAMGRP